MTYQYIPSKPDPLDPSQHLLDDGRLMKMVKGPGIAPVCEGSCIVYEVTAESDGVVDVLNGDIVIRRMQERTETIELPASSLEIGFEKEGVATVTYEPLTQEGQ